MAKLYIVGTPIGNLGDMSPRAVETLSSVDFIAAEDTRVTLRLLNYFGIQKPLISYHEHNKIRMETPVVDRLLGGENGALVTDAGMPAISDPGQELVDACHKNGIEVESVPGPSAVTTALALSGMNVSRFTFEGFLSVNKPSRREHLADIADEKRTMVFYEAPHKLARTLADLYATLGDRRVALIKEMTKIHESVERTTLGAAAEKYAEADIKGEYALVIEGKKDEPAQRPDFEEAVKLARSYTAQGEPASAAAKRAAAQTGYKKGDIYAAMQKQSPEF